MPTYDYRCEADGKIYEVRHPMAQTISTWGELCEVGQLDPADTDPQTPVSKVLTTAGVVSSSALKNPGVPPCMSGGGCSGGGCGV